MSNSITRLVVKNRIPEISQAYDLAWENLRNYLDNIRSSEEILLGISSQVHLSYRIIDSSQLTRNKCILL